MKLIANTECIFCKGKTTLYQNDLTDSRFGVPGTYDYYKCNLCDLVQLAPLPTEEYLTKLYEKYYNFGGGEGRYTKIRERLMMSFVYSLWLQLDGDVSFHSKKGEGRLLDVGCNEGRGMVLYQKNGFTPEGLEINNVAASRAKEKGFQVYSEQIESFNPSKKFQSVVLSNVLEHSLNPKQFLGEASRVLKTGGEVWISCPNVDSWQRKIFGKYWINWHVPFHITHFSKRTLESVLEMEGFEIIKLNNKSPALWFSQSLIAKFTSLPGKKNQNLRNTGLIIFLIMFSRCLMFPLFWLANLLGVGDCLVVIAKKKGN